jgi:hypothetical protein
LQLQAKVLAHLSQNRPQAFTADEIATGIQRNDAAEPIFKICQHLSANAEISSDGSGVTRKFRAAMP